MRIIRNEKQKDNLAKLFWDMGKVVMVMLVLNPLINNPKINLSAIEICVLMLIGCILWVGGYLIDGMKINN